MRKSKNTKRLISFALAFVMVCSFIPLTAFATDFVASTFSVVSWRSTVETDGDSTKNTNYRNGEPVYSQAPLAGYDVIEAGETKLIFVPFCCDRFRRDNKKQPGVVRPEEIPLP